MIRTAIVEGEFVPGARLVEQRIGEMLDLSRTPVREALRALAADELVTIERNLGAVVATMSATEFDRAIAILRDPAASPSPGLLRITEAHNAFHQAIVRTLRPSSTLCAAGAHRLYSIGASGVSVSNTGSARALEPVPPADPRRIAAREPHPRRHLDGRAHHAGP
ncbi:GntR family transcriptional regulator [Mycolicibacterium sp. P1-5]|nr:GntR family transcriptional regulator [Mycolicibacterium sp. P1-5]